MIGPSLGNGRSALGCGAVRAAVWRSSDGGAARSSGPFGSGAAGGGEGRSSSSRANRSLSVSASRVSRFSR